MAEHIETIIIGGGQAGLATSYYLSQLGREHVIVDRAAQPAHAWRNERWDSFALVTPNWSVCMPGAEYDGAEPNGFMPRDEIVSYFENYVGRFRLPIRFNTRVQSVEADDSGKGYRVATSAGELRARNVVVATGHFQKPKVSKYGAQLPHDILQLTVTQYRNPAALPPGAVLVVGSAQSGCQIAEDLNLAGRKVYLCVGTAGRAPRSYRGKDIWEWLRLVGFLDRTPEMLPSPQARFGVAPHLSGARGGHTVNLHQFARDGIGLLGRLEGVTEGKIQLAPDLKENLARADKFEAEMLKMIDGYVAKAGIDAPQEELPALTDGFNAPVLRELDLREAKISTVIWATGFGFDHTWVRPARLDEYGYPVTKENAAAPGLYFVGLPWMPKFSSALLSALGESAARIAEQINA
jgi:putative flavoprotein involved in K+ transport